MNYTRGYIDYDNYKVDNENSIVLLKKGNRYLTYRYDAYIMYKLFNAYVRNLISIISIKEMEEYKKELNKRCINYIIYDKKDIINKTFENNNYNKVKEELMKGELIYN